MQFSAQEALTLEVQLDREAYFPGSLVRGTFTITVHEPTVPVLAVRLRVAGKELMMNPGTSKSGGGERVCFWGHLITLEGHTKKELKQQHPDANKAIEEHANPLHRSPSLNGGAPTGTMRRGAYTYPFEFILPNVLPPSFSVNNDGNVASLVYFVKAYVDLPDHHLVKRRFFNVVSRIGLLQRHNQGTLTKEFRHVLSMCCIIRGRLFVKLELQTPFVVLDQDKEIKINVNIDNTHGSNTIDGVRIQIMHFFTERLKSGKTKVERRCIEARRVDCTVVKGQATSFRCVFGVPPDLMPTLNTVFFDSHYVISVSHDMIMSGECEDQLPIVVLQCLDRLESAPVVSFDKAHFGVSKFNEWLYCCPRADYALWKPAQLDIGPTKSAPSLLSNTSEETSNTEDAAFHHYKISADRLSHATRSVPDPKRWRLQPLPIPYD